MKIIKLVAENVKKLSAVEITPKGEIVTIAGRNGQGKTSVLDSIWWALAGISHIQAQPIRKGESKARIRLEMGEIMVERRFTEKGSTLVVENAKGARFPSPQKMLDELLGVLSFDPLAFARMEPKKQFDELRRIADIAVDFEHLDGLNRADYSKRTDLNRDAKAKRAAAEAIAIPNGLPAEAVDEKALLDRIESAAKHNAEIEQRKARRVQVQRESAEALERAKSARAKAAELIKQAEADEAEAQDLATRLATAEELPAPIDVAATRAELDTARVANQAIGRRAERERIAGEASALEAQAKGLTEQMEAREKAKADAISAAKMPIPDLGFGAGVVTYKGIPLEQASSAEQLRISVAIAMATNPKLRVIRIQDGSLLDDASLAAIAAMAKKHDYQVWIEKVDTTGKIGVVIEDGAVIAVNAETVAAAA